ncbi:MAG TPA: TonB-dependent receptor, partial [Alphaproteobacteria bacterium]|nr:TonB-dependent receptor [Alphaproteobacteria bacterium]
SGFQFLGSTSVEGSFNVKEVFAETLVPLVSDQAFAERLDLNLAARWADYSGSGGIWAYKAGLDWQVYSDLRLRGTYSRDVRAATLSERFDSQGQGASAEDPRILDEEGNPISYAFGQTIGGNPEVDPEKADTITIGTVYQPSYFDGFSVSVDWYQIKVKGAIDQLGVQRIVDDCFAGAEDLCDQITRADEPLPGEPVGRITNIDNVFLNVDQAKVSGIDIETTYNTQLELFGGGAETLGFRALTSWLDENSITNVGAQKDERAGEIPPFGPGFPEWKATGNITYSNGPFTLFVQERFIGSAKRDNEDVEGIDINDNTVSAAYYTDLRLSYNIDAGNGSIEVFGNVTNVFDENPPISASHFNFFGSTQVNESVHGVLGRRFTLGARFRY